MGNDRMRFWRQLLADLAALAAVALAVFVFRFESGLVATPFGIPPAFPYLKLLALAGLIWLLLGQFSGAYRRRAEELEAEIGSLVRLYATVCFAILLFAFVRRNFTYSMTVLLAVAAIALPVIIALRLALRPRPVPLPTAVVATGEELGELFRYFNYPRWGRTRFVQLCRRGGIEPGAELPTAAWGGPETLAPGLRQVWLGPAFVDPAALRELIEWCTPREIAVRYIPRLPALLDGALATPLALQFVSLNLRSEPLAEPRHRLVKRVFDLVVAGGALLVCAPLFLLVGLAVLLDDGFPVFIRQMRLSRDGKTFRMLKFRTMRRDAEEETGPVWARPDDARCTRVGRRLRRFSIDELPQFWNVLRGEMSVVGPRPERPYFVRQFTDRMPYYAERHKVKTGITGWAQVNGLRGNTSIEARTRYDLHYIENWSLWLDLRIVLLTVSEFLFHKTAY